MLLLIVEMGSICSLFKFTGCYTRKLFKCPVKRSLGVKSKFKGNSKQAMVLIFGGGYGLGGVQGQILLHAFRCFDLLYWLALRTRPTA